VRLKIPCVAPHAHNLEAPAETGKTASRACAASHVPAFVARGGGAAHVGAVENQMPGKPSAAAIASSPHIGRAGSTQPTARECVQAGQQRLRVGGSQPDAIVSAARVPGAAVDRVLTGPPSRISVTGMVTRSVIALPLYHPITMISVTVHACSALASSGDAATGCRGRDDPWGPARDILATSRSWTLFPWRNPSFKTGARFWGRG